MSALGKLTNSILSATNENNIQLASINFDFTLLKFEAPKEFAPFGSALSRHRRHDAEEGQPHRTARRLGALFEDLIPDTPKLVEAFGIRVSQIVQTPGISPSGSAIHGPFEKYVGADGTTLWAAATSGIASIGVYLLSCLLARVWDAKQATALWVELVEQRKHVIETAYEENKKLSMSTLLAARQEVSRDDLARWDNSARSWLRCADRAKAFQQKQLTLITRNLDLTLMTDTSTYTSVINVWQQALQGLDALLCGTPIMISNGSLFLASSSWHLFPDLIVLTKETTHVRFRDQLFPPGGVGTVGQEAVVPNLSGSLKWSLTLSHLKYYGDPVVARSNRDFSRVTFREFKLVVLGSLFYEWRVSVREHRLVAQWFLDIWSILGRLDSDARNQFGWLKQFVDAAHDLLLSPEEQPSTQLVQYGQRRAKSFLVDRSEKALVPFFGICNPQTLVALTQENDCNCGVAYLRKMASILKLQPDDAVICYALEASECNDPSMVRHWEIATAVPHTQRTGKRNSDGHLLLGEIHFRCFISRSDEDRTFVENLRSNCVEQGENCFLRETNDSIYREKAYPWLELPLLDSFNGQSQDNQPNLASNKEPASATRVDLSKQPKVKYRLIYGDWRLGLYMKEPMSQSMSESNWTRLWENAASAARQMPSPSGGIQQFSRASINACMLYDYLCLVTKDDSNQDSRRQWPWEKQDPGFKNSAPGLSMLTTYSVLPIKFCTSLFALDLAAGTYQNLGDATVALTALQKPMYEGAWLANPLAVSLSVAKSPRNMIQSRVPNFKPAKPIPLNLARSFSCIARFEAGLVNIKPEELEATLALCSEDSIFVASVVLSDPFDPPVTHKIQRIVGNISHPGLTLLVAPQEPRIRKPTDAFNVVAHAPYDFQREDNFGGTSLHLSFTKWKFPLDGGDERMIDQDVMVVESVISVLDRGRWVADLDIICIDFEQLPRITHQCEKHGREDYNPDYDYFSIDSWDELLDAPEGVGIFRAYGNWAARLAAVSILSQQGQAHSIGVFGSQRVCFRCLEEERKEATTFLMNHESPLPSFCID